jgi:hypothetical protein
MAIDYSNIDSIIAGFDKVLSLSSLGGPPPVPAPLILIGVPQRTGLSPTKIASRIIARKSEAGLPVGALPSGGINPDEIMERIRIEEIVNAITTEMKIDIAIPPGAQSVVSAFAGPIPVTGTAVKVSIDGGSGVAS